MQLTTADGLKSDRVKDIYIDAKGRVWGVGDTWFMRYDGEEVRTFALEGALADAGILALTGDGGEGM